MCILCLIQKWSRRVATMLPWLVIPLIGLWALSQLLPPDFRFEITSPRLACVSVLLVTLFWYEFLMPQLSVWRVRRNARLRERERLEAIEFDKLRKKATRCCRNCLTPYKDQNPAGSRFMCSYCGHISKRPVLDLPVMPGMRVSNSGIMKDLLGKGGKMPSGKWSENGWVCGQDWLENCNCPSGSFVGKPTYWRGDPGGFFPRHNQCLAEKSYSRIVIFACKLLASFFLSLRWLWRKIFRTSTSGDDNSLDAERKEILTKRAYNGASFQESRGEKARRKAEEKRQARLERELLEEEERKQREEVARLVEERRRLRDEKTGAEKDRRKGSVPAKEKESKKGAEKRLQEKRKDKDKNSSKSNSDVEELEKRAGKENEKKREPEKKSEIDQREHQQIGTESVKNPSIEGHGLKVNALNGYNRGNAGTRYLDCMRGTFLSSSKAFSGGSIFGKSSNTADITASKENKSDGFVNHGQASINRRESCVPEHLAGKVGMNGDEKNTHHPVVSDPLLLAAPRKSWQQLFTRSTAAVPPSLSVNVIRRPNTKSQADCRMPQLSNQSQLTQSFETPINFGLPSPFTLPTIQNGCSSSAGFPSETNSIFPCLGEACCDILPEEPDIFEDPCYDPDPVSLLGPVSESLENFQMDLGIERPHGLKNVSASSEFSRSSAIESPISRLRILDDRHANSNRVHTPRAQDVHTSSIDDSSNTNEKGTWQMWNASPLVHNGLGLVGGAANWLVPAELNRSNKEDAVHPSSHRTMESLFTKEEQAVSGIHSQKFFPCNGQNSGMFSSFSRSSDHDPWAQSAFSQPSSGGDNHFYLNPLKETTGNQTIHGSPRVSVVNHPFDQSSTDSWPKNEWAVQDSGETAGSTPVARPHIGGLYTNPNVQSLWSYA